MKKNTNIKSAASRQKLVLETEYSTKSTAVRAAKGAWGAEWATKVEVLAEVSVAGVKGGFKLAKLGKRAASRNVEVDRPSCIQDQIDNELAVVPAVIDLSRLPVGAEVPATAEFLALRDEQENKAAADAILALTLTGTTKAIRRRSEPGRGACLAVWNICDANIGQPRRVVLALCEAAKIAYYTARTQYQYWREARAASAPVQITEALTALSAHVTKE